jgi:hypothetical protein
VTPGDNQRDRFSKAVKTAHPVYGSANVTTYPVVTSVGIVSAPNALAVRNKGISANWRGQIQQNPYTRVTMVAR